MHDDIMGLQSLLQKPETEQFQSIASALQAGVECITDMRIHSLRFMISNNHSKGNKVRNCRNKT